MRVIRREDIESGLVRVTPLLEAPPRAPAEPAPELPPAAPVVGADRHMRLLQGLATALVQERRQLLEELRPELLALVMAVCRELLGREVAADPSLVALALDMAMEPLKGAEEIIARVHPDHLDFLVEHQAGAAQGRLARVRFVGDASLSPGEWRLQSDRGDVDATWDTQLRLMREALAWDMGAESGAGPGGQE